MPRAKAPLEAAGRAGAPASAPSRSLLSAAFAYTVANVDILVVCSLFKVLLCSCYRSTDFEVHRNWLAVTYTLPVPRWYFDDTSQWTLDYPPLFAYLERVLAQLAARFDKDLVAISATAIDTPRVVLFQRMSVVATDLLLLWAVALYAAAADPSHLRADRWRAVFALVLASAGLIIVDNIHFQYNAMLLAGLVVVLALMRAGQHLPGAVAFTLLVLAKHTFLYIAPWVGIFLLATYVAHCNVGTAVARLAWLGTACGAAAAGVLAPALWTDPAGIGKQILVRLFPFGRGLTHTYWAPNAWAAYLAADRVGHAACRIASKAVMTLGPWCSAAAGQADTTAHAGLNTNRLQMLPSPTPAVCAALVLLSMCPLLWATWRGRVLPSRLPMAVACAWLCSFMWGWHVHEKAALYALVPMTLALGEAEEDGTARDGREGKADTGARSGYGGVTRLWWRAMLPIHACLGPLIFTPLEQPVVLLLLVGYPVCSWAVLSGRTAVPKSLVGWAHRDEAPARHTGAWQGLHAVDILHCVVLLGVHVLRVLFPVLTPGLAAGLPFLPLMTTSLACTSGIAYTTLACYWAAIGQREEDGREASVLDAVPGADTVTCAAHDRAAALGPASDAHGPRARRRQKSQA